MRPLPGADGMAVNWLNYKTGIRQLYFRMDVGKKQASVAIEMRHSDLDEQEEVFQKFMALKMLFDEIAGDDWDWELHNVDEDGKTVSRIITRLEGVNIFNEADWPSIISFLKPGLIALDQFWHLAKDHF